MRSLRLRVSALCYQTKHFVNLIRGLFTGRGESSGAYLQAGRETAGVSNLNESLLFFTMEQTFALTLRCKPVLCMQWTRWCQAPFISWEPPLDAGDGPSIGPVTTTTTP